MSYSEKFTKKQLINWEKEKKATKSSKSKKKKKEIIICKMAKKKQQTNLSAKTLFHDHEDINLHVWYNTTLSSSLHSNCISFSC